VAKWSRPRPHGPDLRKRSTGPDHFAAHMRFGGGEVVAGDGRHRQRSRQQTSLTASSTRLWLSASPRRTLAEHTRATVLSADLVPGPVPRKEPTASPMRPLRGCAAEVPPYGIGLGMTNETQGGCNRCSPAPPESPSPAEPRTDRSWVSIGASPVLLSINEAAEALRIGRTKIYELLSDGTLRSVRIGRRRLVHISEVRRFASSLPDQAGNAT
jgi:excisionase family DNA binding protein